MQHARAVLFAPVALALLFGCSPDPVNQTHQGTLAAGDPVHTQDQSFYDEYKFSAGEGFTITVNMTSTAFDSYLHLHGPNGGPNEDWQNDDVASGNLNAQIIQVAPVSGEYTVWANSRGQGETGAYTLTIVTTKP
jgi:hypothetical protein